MQTGMQPAIVISRTEIDVLTRGLLFSILRLKIEAFSLAVRTSLFDSEAPRPQGGASRQLIIFFSILPFHPRLQNGDETAGYR
jgi:hypothetical protein